ncbi:MAG: hypothetical protein C0392_12575 [Syntrophus sp. (in: bacteria)]|nr:hypothetical protein [Syntrophus sp. (in: bacteria)]
MNRATTYEEIVPLIVLCKMGRFLDVQDWISAGNPVNLPLPVEKQRRKMSPLEIAIETGFHSLVEVLLRAGASQEEHNYCALYHAIKKRRPDLVDLLIRHGADAKSVDMRRVFEVYHPEIIEFLIAQNADLDTDNPLAYALCYKIKPALGVFKRHKDRFHSFPEQANIALRFHCKEGNLKWASLMLWAGADPYAKGSDSPDDKCSKEEGASALELASLYGHLEILKLKDMRLDSKHKEASEIFQYASKTEVLKFLLDKGFDPRQLDDNGSSMIQHLLFSMSWDYDRWSNRFREKDIDSSRSLDCIKMIHMLARAGTVWDPDGRALGDARRALLKMKADYIMEFIWIMSEYGACSREKLRKLISTPAMHELTANHFARLEEIVSSALTA